jgi:hypothetical protein
MKEPLRCRQLLGHEAHADLEIPGETECIELVAPVPVHYVRLTGKHFDEQMEPANFVALSRRRAVLETRSPVPAYSNLLLRLDPVSGAKEALELYAKVLRSLDESANRCLLQFTSVSPGVRARLNRILGIDAGA